MRVSRHTQFGAADGDEARDTLERRQVAGVRQWMLDHDVAVRIASGELDRWICAQHDIERMPGGCVARGHALDRVARPMLGTEAIPRPVVAITRDDPIGEQQTHRRLRGAQGEVNGGRELGQARTITTLS